MIGLDLSCTYMIGFDLSCTYNTINCRVCTPYCVGLVVYVHNKLYRLIEYVRDKRDLFCIHVGSVVKPVFQNMLNFNKTFK